MVKRRRIGKAEIQAAMSEPQKGLRELLATLPAVKRHLIRDLVLEVVGSQEENIQAQLGNIEGLDDSDIVRLAAALSALGTCKFILAQCFSFPEGLE